MLARSVGLATADLQLHRTRLAPFYDLVSTRAITRIDQNLALSVGSERNPNKIRWQHWAIEAQKCGIRPQFLQKLILELTHNLLGGLEQVRADFEGLYGPCPAQQRIERVVRKQCGRTLNKS